MGIRPMAKGGLIDASLYGMHACKAYMACIYGMHIWHAYVACICGMHMRCMDGMRVGIIAVLARPDCIACTACIHTHSAWHLSRM